MTGGTKFRIALAALALFAAGGTACRGGGSNDDAAAPEGGGTILVRAESVSFDITRIEVPAGASMAIVFVNADDVTHTLTVYVGTNAEGAVVADTGQVEAGAEGETAVLFTSGEHAFRCEVHPDRMSGVIVVQ